MEEIDMDKLIQQMFPLSLFSALSEMEGGDALADFVYEAYSQGFKDGYSKRNPDSILKLTFVENRQLFKRFKKDDNA